MISAYIELGDMIAAKELFSRMLMRDVITWNSMINGLTMHGMGLEALELFDHMLDAAEEPDGITFVGFLSACVHMSLVERGFARFKSMKQISTDDKYVVISTNGGFQICGSPKELIQLMNEFAGMHRRRKIFNSGGLLMFPTPISLPMTRLDGVELFSRNGRMMRCIISQISP
ncbi:hypothetical protein M5K25_027888 [Dendrobium thyrsiflorum]|uniref:Pentatricopeptide repeat-containing protein n=1 Tax=Dendrobium thyrsiflorum TaxID=117978 RepID=A0ABD0TV64_DENTH